MYDPVWIAKELHLPNLLLLSESQSANTLHFNVTFQPTHTISKLPHPVGNIPFLSHVFQEYFSIDLKG